MGADRERYTTLIDIVKIKQAIKVGQLKVYVKDGKIYLQDNIGEVVEIGKLEPDMEGGTQHEKN